MDGTPMLLDTNSFGGHGMGAGFIGGLILGSLWNNGGGFGFGNNNNGAGAVIANQLGDSINRVSDQVNQATISALNTSSNQNMFMGNLVNSTSDAITAAVNNQGSTLNTAIQQQTITGLQSQQAMADRLCAINNNITTQGYESRLEGQQLAALLASQHASLSRQIFEENCKDRELQREIQTQALRDKLSETQATLAAKDAQINLTNQLTAQTAYLVAQLKPASTTAAG